LGIYNPDLASCTDAACDGLFKWIDDDSPVNFGDYITTGDSTGTQECLGYLFGQNGDRKVSECDTPKAEVICQYTCPGVVQDTSNHDCVAMHKEGDQDQRMVRHLCTATASFVCQKGKRLQISSFYIVIKFYNISLKIKHWRLLSQTMHQNQLTYCH